MKRRTDKGVEKQVGLSLVQQVGQRLLPLVSGIAATRQGLLEWVHDFGLKALDELMRDDAARIVGEKGKHRADRTHHYWGRTRSELTFGGRRISVEKPRVRSKDGREAALPALEEFRRSLATTNSIENLVSSIRRVTRNVKRWRGGDMIRRWAGLGLFNAAKRFRRIKGYREMPKLVTALRAVAVQAEVA